MKQRVLFMIEGISAVTLGTDEMPRAVRFYCALGFEVLRGNEQSSFTSFRAGMSYLNLIAQPTERRWSWWGRVIFYVADVDALYERALAAGCQPTTAPRERRVSCRGCRGQSFEQAPVLRSDTWYHTCPLGADIAAAARIPFPAHRHSAVAAHRRVAAERE